MEIKFQNHGPEQWQAQIIVILCCENEHLLQRFSELALACQWLASAPGLKDFKGKAGEIAILYGEPNCNIPRALLIGVGKREDVELVDIRDAIGASSRKCRQLGVDSALIFAGNFQDLPGGRDRLLEEAVCAFKLGLYEFTKLKTKKQNILMDPDWLGIGMANEDNSAQHAARKGELAANAVALARDLDNMPANMLYPELVASHAIDLAQKHGFHCRVLDDAELRQIGAGCLLGVGQGSAHPPRMIVLEYSANGMESAQPYVLIGKGMTFDSGGLCLKPAANMGQMKCDMSGAGAVLAVIDAAAQAGAPARLVGILACAENMPDGRAYRPGDVLTALNGETVEVVNTDAEGRLALADALAYAQKNFNPSAIVDIATLTGACAVALGTGLGGLFSNDEKLADMIAAYGAATGENWWRLPLWQPYAKALKSEIADISHTAAREGGAITAALFLKNFVDDSLPWAHLDIAGVDWNNKSNSLCTEGATAFGVRTLLELATRSGT